MNDGTACAAFENHPPAVGNQIGLIVEDWRPASLGLARRRFVKPTRDVHEGALVESHTRAGRNRLGPEGQTGSGLTITGRLLSAIHARLQRHDYGAYGQPPFGNPLVQGRRQVPTPPRLTRVIIDEMLT